MSKRILGGALAALMALGAFQVGQALGAPTTQQRTKAKAAETALKKAHSLNAAKKYREAGQALKQAEDVITELGSDAETAGLVAPLYKQVANLHGDLELQGVMLGALVPEPKAAGKSVAAKDPAAKNPAARATMTNPAPTQTATTKTAAAKTPGKSSRPLGDLVAETSGGVSFTKEVAPMLVQKCASCHIRGSKGDFKFNSFASLMKGTKAGEIITPKNGEASRIVEVIRTGDMPRSGGKVAPEALAALTKWIDEGAKFDGTDPNADIVDLKFTATKQKKNGSPEIEVTLATGKESVSFASDIAPVLVDRCYDCHSGKKPKAKFDVGEFKSMLKGGESGPSIFAGKPDQSIFLQKLKGTAKDGGRMPKGGRPLSAETIAKIETWISEGAAFDGSSTNANIKQVAALAHAEKVPAAQLAKERAELGAHNWKLILPDGGADRVQTENFVVFGNTGKDSLQETARIAEEQGAKLQKLLKLPTGPLIRGGATIFVFNKKYDYREVGKMLESREIPADSHAHWTYTTIDAYICLVPPTNDEYSYRALIGQEVAALMLASLGRVPHWFAEGSGRNFASKLESKDTRPRQWESEATESLSSGARPDAFMVGAGASNDSVAYMFMKQLMSDQAKYQKVLAGLRSHVPFEDAFSQAYGASPAQLLAMWTGK